MKILILFALVSLYAHAEEMPVNIGEGKTVTVKYYSPKNKMAFFQVYQDGKLLQHFTGMGSYFQPFTKDSQESIKRIDLDGDSTEELITRTYWEVSSGIHVFKWNSKKKEFELLVTAGGEQYLIFDKNSEIELDEKNKILTVKYGKEKKGFTWKIDRFERVK